MICYNIFERGQLAIGRFYWTSDFRAARHLDSRRDAHARRNGYAIDVPLSPYIIRRSIGQRDRAISRIAIARDERIRHGTLHAGLATSARRGNRKFRTCVTHTSRSRMVTNAGESPTVLLPHLDSRAACTAAYKSRPYPLPTLRFPAGYFGLSWRRAVFFVRRAHDNDHAKLCHVDKIKNN